MITYYMNASHLFFFQVFHILKPLNLLNLVEFGLNKKYNLNNFVCWPASFRKP